MYISVECFYLLHLYRTELVFAGKSFPRILSTRKERSSLEQSFKNAAALWPEGVWLFSTDLHTTSRLGTVEKCLG